MNTKPIQVRIPQELWDEIQKKAKQVREPQGLWDEIQKIAKQESVIIPLEN